MIAAQPNDRAVVIGPREQLLGRGLVAREVNWLVDAPESGAQVSVQVRHRAMVVEMEHPQHGRVPTLGTPLKVDGRMALAPCPPARLGEHTDTVLRGVLGYTDERIARLRQEGAIG